MTDSPSNSPDLKPTSISDQQQQRTREAAKRVILLTVFLDMLGFGIIIPQLGVYAAQFGADPRTVGFLASTYSAMGFLFTPFWGALSDRIGRRPVLLYSIFGTAVGYVIFAFSNSMPLLFLSRFVDGVTSGNISTAQAYLTDITPPEERAKTFGQFGAIFGIGFAIGPSIGALISHLPGIWGTNFGLGIFTAALSFINWAMALKRLPETLSPEIRSANLATHAQRRRKWQLLNVRGFSRALSLPGLSLVVAISFILTAAFAMPLQGTYSLFLITRYVRPAVQERIKADPQAAIDEARRELGSSQKTIDLSGGEGAMPLAEETKSGGEVAPYPKIMGGDFDLTATKAPPDLSWRHIEKLLVARLAGQQAAWIFAVIGLTAMIVQGGFIGLIKKRLGEVNMVLVGTLVMTVSLALIPLPNLFYGEFPIMALLAMGNSIAMPVLTALSSELAPEAERGEIIGVFQSVQSLARIIGPIAGGQLFNYISPNAPYWAGAAVMFLAFLIALKLRGAAPQNIEAPAATAET